MFWPPLCQERPHGRTGSSCCLRGLAWSIRGPDKVLFLFLRLACRAPQRCKGAQHTRSRRRPSVTDEADFLWPGQLLLNRPMKPQCTIHCLYRHTHTHTNLSSCLRQPSTTMSQLPMTKRKEHLSLYTGPVQKPCSPQMVLGNPVLLFPEEKMQPNRDFLPPYVQPITVSV